MKRIFLTLVVVVMATGLASAQITGTKHDLRPLTSSTSPEICVYCHTPHGASPSVPLWNHTLSVAGPYQMYSSPTINMTITQLQNGTGVSNLCLSCHDGTVAVNNLVNQPPAGTALIGTIPAGWGVSATGFINGSTTNLSTNLSNDHPVNLIYNTAQDPAFQSIATATLAGVRFFGTGANEVQCASCHNPHDNTAGRQPFLRMSNTNSAMCLACHIK